MTLLKLEHISKEYHSNRLSVQALRDVSFTVQPGEFLSLAGPSGSGKTTALNLIGCLDQPTAGDLYIEKTNVASRSKSELAMLRRMHIGFVFQTFNLIPILTAFENVEFPLLLKGDLSTDDRRKRVRGILTEVGLGDLMDRKPAEMSGGQQQRVAIARALVKEPKLILADEPTANLDSDTGKEVLKLMKKLNENQGVTFIFSTHDPMVMEFARRIIRLKDGEIQRDTRGN